MGLAPKVLARYTLSIVEDILVSLDEQFQIVHQPEYARLVNYSTGANEPIHRWFRYREGYSTKLIEYLVKGTPKGKYIVDPFCGAGTTLLAARNLGYRSVGVDANPLSVFVAKVKTRNYTGARLRRFEEICGQIRKLQPDGPQAGKPRLSIIDKVFLPDVLSALLILRHFVETKLARDDRDFFFLAWLSILEEVSNAYKEGNGIKYKNRKRTKTGYVEIPMETWQKSLFPQDKFDYVVGVFLERVRMMILDAGQFNGNNPEPDVFEGDALALDEFVQSESAGLVVFSPPYANNFNYFKAYKVELWMGGFVSNYPDMQELNGRSLRSHVETHLRRDSDLDNWYPEELDALIEMMAEDSLWTSRIPKAVRGYFYDMHKVIQNIYDILEPGGRCVIVVGNSAYGSVLIPTDSLLAEAASAEGFKVEKIAVARHLTTSSQQKQALEPLKQYLRESLVFLQKPKTADRQQPVMKNGHVRYHYVTELPRFPRQSTSLVYVIRNRGLTDLTHGLHKFPSKFIPHVPRWALEKYLNKETGKVVLDPFCGSGTTLVEGLLAGHVSYGIDIDPLAKLISKVKTTPIARPKLIEAVQKVKSLITENRDPIFRPKIPTLTHWFKATAIRDLGIIRDAIEEWRDEDRDIYDFLIICLSSIIRRVSNADNQSLKTYVSGTHPKHPPAVIPLFLKALNESSEAVIQLGVTAKPGGSAQIIDDFESRSFGASWLQCGFPVVDLGITSPPYIKTIDILYNEMAEYFWVGDLFGLENQAKQNEARKQYIGTEKIAVEDYREKKNLGIPAIDELIDRIYELNKQHAFIVYRYFDDMRQHFGQMLNVLNSSAPYVVVVGDSTVSNIPIPTHDLLADVAASAGFQMQSQFAYEIRNRYMRFPRQGRGGIVDLDWILTFRKI